MLKLLYLGRLLECCVEGFPERASLSATMAIMLLLAAALVAMRPRRALFCVVVLSACVSAIGAADILHARFFGDPGSVTELTHIWQVPLVASGAAAATRLSDALLFLDVIAGGALVTLFIRKPCVWREKTVNGQLAIALSAAAVLASIPPASLAWHDPSGVLQYSIGRRQVVAVFGWASYHVYDVWSHLRTSTMAKWGVSAADRQRAVDWFVKRGSGAATASPLSGVSRGRNVVVVQSESLQAFVIGLELDGQPVAPNLTAFARESLDFKNFYDQAHAGGTSDAVFLAMQSLHPAAAGAVATRYIQNDFLGLPEILGRSGYASMAAMGSGGEFWNMRLLFEKLGFQDIRLAEDYANAETFGQGVADGEFFPRTTAMMDSLPRPFLAFLISVSNHVPYDLPAKHRALRLGRWEGTVLGHYLQSVHYFDAAFGDFIKGLRIDGLLDESIIVVYGDHQGWLDDAELAQLLGLPMGVSYQLWRAQKRLPFLIRLPEASERGSREPPGGQIDIAPTLLSLLGVSSNQPPVMMGRDLIAQKTPGSVVFRDGGFVDWQYAFTDTRREFTARPVVTTDRCYRTDSGRPVDCPALAAARRQAQEALMVSDLVLQGNLVPAIAQHLAGDSRSP